MQVWECSLVEIELWHIVNFSAGGICLRTLAYMDWYSGPHRSSSCALHARAHEGAASRFHRYRGPPGRARYMPGLAAMRADLEAFILQAR